MDKLYKCVPYGWLPADEKLTSFLICKKNITHTSKNKEIILFKVIKRWSKGSYGEYGFFTDSFKNVEYTPNEIKNVGVYHGNFTEKNKNYNDFI